MESKSMQLVALVGVICAVFFVAGVDCGWDEDDWGTAFGYDDQEHEKPYNAFDGGAALDYLHPSQYQEYNKRYGGYDHYKETQYDDSPDWVKSLYNKIFDDSEVRFAYEQKRLREARGESDMFERERQAHWDREDEEEEERRREEEEENRRRRPAESDDNKVLRLTYKKDAGETKRLPAPKTAAKVGAKLLKNVKNFSMKLSDDKRIVPVVDYSKDGSDSSSKPSKKPKQKSAFSNMKNKIQAIVPMQNYGSEEESHSKPSKVDKSKWQIVPSS